MVDTVDVWSSRQKSVSRHVSSCFNTFYKHTGSFNRTFQPRDIDYGRLRRPNTVFVRSELKTNILHRYCGHLLDRMMNVFRVHSRDESNRHRSSKCRVSTARIWMFRVIYRLPNDRYQYYAVLTTVPPASVPIRYYTHVS